SLNQHIKNTYQFSPFSKAFVDILAAEQTPDNPAWYQGTADAVRQVLHHLDRFNYKYALILSGDQLYQMDFHQMLENHIEKGADISIATIPVGEREAPEFGIMKVNSDGTIPSFIEKPAKDVLENWMSDTGEEMIAQGRVYLASMGIYIFNRELLVNLLKNEFSNATDFGKEIIPSSIAQRKVVSYQYDGYWTDIGNIYSYFEANLALTHEIPQFNLFDNEKAIYTRARMLPPAKFGKTLVEHSIIAEGSIVQADSVTYSLVGIRSRIGTGTVIESSYIIGNDYFETLEELAHNTAQQLPHVGIGANCVIKNAIVDKNVRIGNNVRIVGGNHLPNSDQALYAVKDGIIVVKKGAVLNDGFAIE
ncbi:MAG: glucose-1-phosphate adenylyltransferase, partial [Dinghuibacter sp.]|nr:glucose-1-phosphate adenylyltransferase [Dinghuibacter sp.]